MMKHSFQKKAALVTAIVSLAFAAAGCSFGGKPEAAANKAGDAPSQTASLVNEKGFPITKEPIQLKALGSKFPSHQPWGDIWFFQEYEKLTNVKVQWELAEQNVFPEKRNLLLASGTLPDFLMRAQLEPDDELKYAKNGTIIPLDSLIDKHMPNLKALLEQDPELRKAMTTADGHIYTLPQLNLKELSGRAVGATNGKFFIRKDWLDKLGLKPPTTVDEYYQVLKAFKEQDPNGNGQADEIPLIDQEIGQEGNLFGFLQAFKGWYGLGTRGAVNNDGYIDIDENGKLRFIPTSTRYKEMLEFTHKLYKDGLLDKEVFTLKQPQVLAKAKKDLVGSYFSGNPTNIYSIDRKQNDELEKKLIQLPPLKGPHGDQLFSSVRSVLVNNGTFAITKTNKYPEATARWVDYLYSREGSTMFRYGREGEHFQLKPEPKLLIDKNDYGKYFIRAGGAIPQAIYEDLENAFAYPIAQKMDKEAERKVAPYLPKKLWGDFYYTPEESKVRSTKFADIQTFVKEMMGRFIVEGNFGEWDSYVAKIDKMGLKDVMETYQKALDRSGYEK